MERRVEEYERSSKTAIFEQRIFETLLAVQFIDPIWCGCSISQWCERLGPAYSAVQTTNEYLISN
jgi:hypothetical protein